MPTARELPYTTNHHELLDAARQRKRIRVHGTLSAIGDGYNARYRNCWLVIDLLDGTRLRITATPDSPLGTAAPGSGIDLACTLTGIWDLAENTFHGHRAQLLHLDTSPPRPTTPGNGFAHP